MESLTAKLLSQEFHLPPVFDLGAVFFFALTGALTAMRRGYDFIGLFTIAFVSGLGGALMRDGIFLQGGPPLLTTDARYLIAVAAACLAGWIVGHRLDRFRKLIAVLDAIGLGAYTVVGVQKSLAADLSIPAALMVGAINACGGGLLRDIITREEPLMLKPGQFYVMASLLGGCLFIAGTQYLQLPATAAALTAVGVTFIFRMLAIVFNWRTVAIQPLRFETEEDKSKPDPTNDPPT